MDVAVRFDGKTFVPQKELQLAEGVEGTVSVPDQDSFEAWVGWTEKRGPLAYVDLVNLDRGDLYP